MAHREAKQAFKFAGGIETKMDSKAVPSVRLLGLENGVFTKAISIQKRNGYRARSMAIDGGTTISGAKRHAKRDNELLLFTGNRCYSKQGENDQWTDAGPVICAVGSDRAAVHTSSQQTMPDHATNGGVIAYAWEDSLGGVWWSTVDAESKVIYRSPTQADALGQRPRCVAVGDVIHIYYAVPSTRSIMVIVVNPSSPSAAVTPAILVNDLDTTNPVYDACPTTRADTPALIAWHEHATTNIRIGYAHQSGALGTPANGNPSVYNHAATMGGTSPLACAFKYVDGGVGDWLFLSYIYDPGPSIEGTVTTLTGGSLAAPIAVSSSAIAYATPVQVTRTALAVSDAVWVAFEETAAQPSQRYTVTNTVAIDASAGTERTIRSVGLASRAFQAGNASDVFAVFVHDTTYFNVYLTLRLSDFVVVARQLAASAAGAPARTHLSSVHVEDDVAHVVLPYLTRLASANSDKFTEKALRHLTLDFDNDDAHQTAQIGMGLYMAGGCPQHYDGRWNEQGFHVGPEYMPAPVKASGGAMTASSSYLYVLWYEWTDAFGEVHRGPTSIGTTVVTGGTDTQVTMEVPTLRVTAKSNVRICVARSLPGDTSRLWRVSSLDPTATGPNGYIANDKTVDSVTFVDRMSDTTLRLQERIYTTGGILSNDPASLGSLVVVAKNRLFFSDSSNGSVVRYSQRIATGYGLEVAPELAHDINPDGGDITALAEMDGNVIVFKQSAIFAFGGDGPTETGSNAIGGFSDARKQPGNVGCTDPSSIVEIPAGLMFKSAQGIWLLRRDFTVEYVGAPAEAYNSQTVRRATAMPDRTQVVFLTDSGRTLLYDHLFGQWATFTNHEGLDSVVVNGSYYYLRNDGVVWKETLGEYSDNGARITLRLETAWLHMQEHLQGFARFWKLLLLGTHISPHQLGIQYRLSYNEEWSDPSWLDATDDTDSTGWLTGEGCNEIGVDPIGGTVYGEGAYGDGPYGGTGPDIYQWRFGIHEKGQSIQFRFEDFEKYGLAGASFELTEMMIVGGVIGNDYRPFDGSRST